MENLLGEIGVATILFLSVISVLWIAIPFILISINSNIKKNTFQIKEMMRLIHYIEIEKDGARKEGEFDFLRD